MKCRHGRLKRPQGGRRCRRAPAKRGHRHLETAAIIGDGAVGAVVVPLLMAYAAFWTYKTLSKVTA